MRSSSLSDHFAQMRLNGQVFELLLIFDSRNEALLIGQDYLGSLALATIEEGSVDKE